MALLTPEVIQNERLHNMARVFTKVDRVLSSRDDVYCEVVYQDMMEAPAWSDGRVITFNTAKIGTVTSTDDIIEVTGLNYHELAHILYTPRVNSWLSQQVQGHGMAFTFNILEDQRIETLLTATYPATAPYFTTTFMRYCLADERQWDTVFVLAHGRRYLPKKVRKQFMARFAWQPLVKKFAKIIDEYRLLNVMKDDKRAFELIKKFDYLLTQIRPPQQPHGHGTSGRPEVPKNGRPDSAKAQQEAGEWAEWYDEERDEQEGEEEQEQIASNSSDTDGGDADDEMDDESEGEGDGDGEGGSGDGDGEGDDTDDDTDADGDGSGSGDDSGDASDDSDMGAEGGGDGSSSEDGESDGESGRGDSSSDGDDNDSDADPDESGSDSAGSGSGGEPPLSIDDMRDLLNEVKSDIDNSEDIQREVRTKQKSIVDGDGNTSQELNVKKYRFEAPTGEDINAAKKFGRELERLRADLDPGWHTHKSSGRINIQRAIQGADIDTVWDQWDEGKSDRSDIECVLYVDFSSSMSGYQMEQSCRAMWTIKRAIEAIKGSVTVYAYNDESFLLYRSDHKAEHDKVRMIGPSGSTDPSVAINDSLRVFHNSRKTTKIAIFLTDGQWNGTSWYTKGNGERWEQTIPRMNAHGIVTALAYIGGHYGRVGQLSEVERNYCQIGHSIQSAGDLIPFAKQIVKAAMLNGDSNR